METSDSWSKAHVVVSRRTGLSATALVNLIEAICGTRRLTVRLFRMSSSGPERPLRRRLGATNLLSASQRHAGSVQQAGRVPMRTLIGSYSGGVGPLISLLEQERARQEREERTPLPGAPDYVCSDCGAVIETGPGTHEVDREDRIVRLCAVCWLRAPERRSDFIRVMKARGKSRVLL